MSGQFLWEIVRDNHSFIKKGLHGAIFSSEPGNLFNKHSFKYSGLVNADSFHVAIEGDNLKLVKPRPKSAKQPKKAKESIVIKKNARKALVSIGKEVASVRPDLKAAALARASALAKSLRVKKATVAK